MSFFNRFNNIKAGRDVIGRDSIVNNNLPQPTQLTLLSACYKAEVDNKITTLNVIDELRHYSSLKSEIRDLKQKLDEAGFSYLIDEAEELKELVAKLIIKNQHYKSAQKIITYLLADVESTFNSKIKPKLDANVTEADIKTLFRICLEQEVQSQLGENVLEIFNRQINGMVFFLTGNCHLEWE
jgi:hypothetical protein